MSSWLRHLVTAMVAAVLVWLGTPTASALPIVPAPALAHDYDAALNGGQVVENAMERGPPGISYHYNLAHPAVGSAAHGNSQRASDPLAPDTYGYDPDTRLAQVDHSADTTTNAPGAASVALSSLQPDLVAAKSADELAHLGQGWRATSFGDEAASFEFHFGKHGVGAGVTREQYAQDALNWAWNPVGTGKPIQLKDGTGGLRYRTPGGGPGGITDLDGNIITFWYR